MRKLFVCGMQSEVEAITRDKGDVIVFSAGDRDLLQDKLDRILLTQKFDRVISFGLCGALDPKLKTGDRANSAGSASVIATPEERATFWAKVKPCNAVDNETDIAGLFAKKNGMEFITFRVVLDQTDDYLPPASLLPLKEDGTPNAGAIAWSVLRNPLQIPALVSLGLKQRTALAVLKEMKL